MDVFAADPAVAEASARSLLDAAAKSVDPGSAPVEAVLVEGPAAEALLAVAGSADVLVVGSRGHSELPGLLLGW